eukprot:6180562-Pleurochrysis_carterae.AAC.1
MQKTASMNGTATKVATVRSKRARCRPEPKYSENRVVEHVREAARAHGRPRRWHHPICGLHD